MQLFISPLIGQAAGHQTFNHLLGKKPDLVIATVIATANVTGSNGDVYLFAGDEMLFSQWSDNSIPMDTSGLVINATQLIVNTSSFSTANEANLAVWSQQTPSTAIQPANLGSVFLKIYLFAF